MCLLKKQHNAKNGWEAICFPPVLYLAGFLESWGSLPLSLFLLPYRPRAKADDAQHKRTKTCSVCKASSEEYADHVDANGDGKCDDCGATVSLTVTWDAGSNGGTIDGKAAYSETVQPNSKPTAPDSVPVKTGYTFKG